MNPKSKTLQQGVVLLEALISILIFSFGVLAIVGLQAASVANASDSKYRSEAGFYANRLIGEMWTSDRGALVAYQTSGPKYSAWYADMLNATASAGLLGLPGADLFPPTVVVTPVNNPLTGKPTSYDVTVTVFWQSPGNVMHQHVVLASLTTD